VGTVRLPPDVQFFASIILNDSGILSQAETVLTAAMGAIASRTPLIPFSHSTYYGDEMGEGLVRRLVLFEGLLPRDRLAEVKLQTNEIEKRFACGGRRRVNIDPGYLSLEHIVLATTKGYTHRIYLGSGIYADLTLVYENGTYRGLGWTYPDYRQELVPVFNGWREAYKRLLKCRKA
jgi:hypothetical protein